MTRSITLALAVICLVLAPEAAAQLKCVQRFKPSEPQRTGMWFIKGQVNQRPLTLHVAGGVATTLVFDKVEVGSAAFAGGVEKRFRTLEVGKQVVVLIPKQDVADGEHLSLMVTLKDGTEIPFDLVSPGADHGSDGQVDVFLNEESIEAVQQSLDFARSEIDELQAANLQYQFESYSPEYALATLLAQGLTNQTPFVVDTRKTIVDAGVDLAVITFRRRHPKTDVSKTAVVFEVTNKNPKELWTLDGVRLMSARTGEMKTAAVRVSASALGVGQTGRVAVVFDFDQFGMVGNTDHLLLELLRAGNVRQAYVELAKEDDDAEPVPLKLRAPRVK